MSSPSGLTIAAHDPALAGAVYCSMSFQGSSRLCRRRSVP